MAKSKAGQNTAELNIFKDSWFREHLGMLTFREKRLIYDEVQAVYDAEDAKSRASDIGYELTDEQAKVIAADYRKNFNCEIDEYSQMVDAIEKFFAAA